MDADTKLAQTSIKGKNGGTLIPITSATASDLARRRWAKYRQAAARRVTAEAESIDPTATTAAEAWGLAVAKQYTTLLDSDKPRGDDLLRIGQAIGAVPLTHEGKAQDTTAQAQALAAVANAHTAETLVQLWRDVQAQREREVIDAE